MRRWAARHRWVLVLVLMAWMASLSVLQRHDVLASGGRDCPGHQAVASVLDAAQGDSLSHDQQLRADHDEGCPFDHAVLVAPFVVQAPAPEAPMAALAEDHARPPALLHVRSLLDHAPKTSPPASA